MLSGQIDWGNMGKPPFSIPIQELKPKTFLGTIGYMIKIGIWKYSPSGKEALRR